jgi:hypothetical protein
MSKKTKTESQHSGLSTGTFQSMAHVALSCNINNAKRPHGTLSIDLMLCELGCD